MVRATPEPLSTKTEVYCPACRHPTTDITPWRQCSSPRQNLPQTTWHPGLLSVCVAMPLHQLGWAMPRPRSEPGPLWPHLQLQQPLCMHREGPAIALQA